jgi:PAS domain S-box-containing protein
MAPQRVTKRIQKATTRLGADDANGVARQPAAASGIFEADPGADNFLAAETEIRRVIDATPLVLVRCGRDLRYKFINPAGAALFGLTPAHVVGRPIIDVMGKRAFAVIQPYVRTVLRGEPIEFEAEIPYPKGRRWMRVRYDPERDHRDKVIGWIASIVDITEVKAAQLARREYEERFARFMANLTGLAWIKDVEGRYLYANDAAIKAFQRPPHEIIGLTDDEIFPPEVARAFRANDRRALEKGGAVEDVETLTHADGTVHYSVVTKFPIEGPDGKIAAIGGMAFDITEQKQAELHRDFLFEIAEKIRVSRDVETLLREIAEALGKYLAVHRCLFNEIDLVADVETVRGDYFRTGESVAGTHRISDYSEITSAEAKCGRTVVNHDSRRDPRTAKYFRKVYGPNKELAYIAVPMMRNGRWVASLWCSDDKPRAWTEQEVGLVEMIAERVWTAVERLRAEAAIRASEAELRRAQERFILAQQAGGVGIWDWDIVTGKTYWSETTWAFYGETRTDLNPDEVFWRERVHEDDRERVLANLRNALESGGDRYWDEFRIARRDGSVLWIETSGTIVRDASGKPVRVYGVNVDITRRREADERIRESEKQLRLVTDSMPSLISYMDRDQRYRFVNRAYSDWFGRPTGDIVGRRVRTVLGPKAYAKVKPYIEQALNGEPVSFETLLEYRDAGARFVQVNYIPDLNRDGKVVGVFVLVNDLTDRRRAEEAVERAKSELEVRVAERTRELADANELLRRQMAEQARSERQRIGLLKKIVTIQEDERTRIARDLHDQLGQRLTALRLKIRAAKGLASDDPVLNKRISRLEEIAEGLDNEVSYLAWELRPSALDGNGLAKALEQHVTEWSRHTGVAAEFRAVGIDRRGINAEIETNLYRIAQEALNNAAKHSRASKANVILEGRAGKLVLIVEDDGVGFSAARGTAKMQRRGGLGLIGMRERAAVIGGTLEIESKPGKGTTVFVRVPLS